MSPSNLLSVRQAGPTTEICVDAAGAALLSALPPLRPVKETRHVSLEYDPILRRKVLNTYEILREIGRGEHGRVKLARDLVHDELVAIKIVSRKSKHDRPRLRRPLAPDGGVPDAEAKIRREIAIMKRCHHKYIVRLREVLDDRSMYKIYLVLEYMDRGEVQWKRSNDGRATDANAIPLTKLRLSCDTDLLSSTYAPNLTFRQARRIFRDVVLGLEYLHMQGIVHRDIKPANLLVAHDHLVKILDFGVSFASSLSLSDDGVHVSEMDLAKTVGTPAFFAPELCHTNLADDDAPAPPPVTHKIDIWALGVTLYCLLFGRVPFNADSEFQLFDVIVHSPVVFPESPTAFNSPLPVSPEEFALAQDLLLHMLDKNPDTRYDIVNIKAHPFTLMDLEDDMDKLREFFFLNASDAASTAFGAATTDPLHDEVDAAVVGVGARIRSSLVRALRADASGLHLPDADVLRKLSVRLERSISGASSSDDLSRVPSLSNSSAHLGRVSSDTSVILSESQRQLSPTNSRLLLNPGPLVPLAPLGAHALGPLGLSHSWFQTPPLASVSPAAPSPALTNSAILTAPSIAPVATVATVPTIATVTSTPTVASSIASAPTLGSSPGTPSTHHPRLSISSRNNLLLHDMSPAGSRKGSSAGILEAARVETKRNVVGDVYLKNQSAIDAFKGIQQLDQKRRKSSAYAILASTTSSKSNMSPGTFSPCTLTDSPMVATSMEPSSLKIKVGPISIDNSRRPSSVISLPMTESFASLDSFNDNYLSHKYEEFRKKKVGEAPADGDSSTVGSISEKFSNFNLGSLMTATGLKPTGDEQIAPKSTFNFKTNRSSSVSSSVSSYSTSSSSSSSSESDEEEGNLTLKFSSKVAPRAAAPFLSLSSRAFSHDSNLRGLAHQKQASTFYPMILTNALDVEDVPLDLMDDSSVSSNSRFEAVDMTPTASALVSNMSSATITQDLAMRRPQPSNPPMKSSKLRQEVFPPSPVDPVPSGRHSAHTDTQRTTLTSPDKGYVPVHNGYFNNHYRKDHAQLVFPKAKHLDNDRESNSKQILKQNMDRRPSYIRSNSISVGLLQRERSLKDLT